MAEQLAEKEDLDPTRAVLARLAEDVGREGFQRHLDADHVVTYVHRGPKLLVAFETLENVLSVYGADGPIGLDFAEDKNWSLLHVAARTDSWFRAKSIYEFFDEMVDECFFEDFDQVAFFGSGMGAYGACAYSVSAPGANVLAIAPQATLDTERAGWDQRFPDAKRLVFNDRYGYAPDMVEGARKVYILFDPFRPLDHVHASLFQGPNVYRLKCRHLDGLIELALREMSILHQVVEGCTGGTLNEMDFYHLLRKRRGHTRYLRTLLHALSRRNRPLRMAFLCKYVLEHKQGGPTFRKTLARAKEVISRHGPLPDWLLDDDEDAPKPVSS
ncbi:MAG: phosphoadenosine phosphosulfate reductase [Pseudomonadota bacterium]